MMYTFEEYTYMEFEPEHVRLALRENPEYLHTAFLWEVTNEGDIFWSYEATKEKLSLKATGILSKMLEEYEDFIKSEDPRAVYEPQTFDRVYKVTSTGGPSSYYDMPFHEWVTVNDMMEHLAEHKWGRYGIHLKDIFKGLCRWGEKSGTDILYDTKKVIYYGCRILMMVSGKEALRSYLTELLEDRQFK